MGNAERNSFVKAQITEATIRLLGEKELFEISISEIINKAEVSRNSFYRNYTDKTDVILQYLRKLYSEWDTKLHENGEISNNELYASLFGHIKANSEFYLLLKHRGLSHLFLTVLNEQNGAQSSDDNLWAYIKSYLTYGTFGWIEEWVKRGMKESEEEMMALLQSQDKQQQ